jgi:hypothetical protein
MRSRFMIRFTSLAVAVIALTFVSQAHAQWAIYMGASGAKLHIPNTTQLYGSTFGFYRDIPEGKFDLGFDFRGSLLFGGNVAGQYTDQRLDYGLLGARASLPQNKYRVTPYVEGLVGTSYVRGGLGLVRENNSSGALQALGGLDVKITKSIDWRAAEFSYSRIKGQLYAVHPDVLTTGVVFHLNAK